MGIVAEIKDIRTIKQFKRLKDRKEILYNKVGFECQSYANWKTIAENCPILEEVFRNEYSKNGDGNMFPRKYFVEYKDPRLKKLMSEIDKKYKVSDNTKARDVISFLAKEILNVVHKSMSRKKDIEVRCLWR